MSELDTDNYKILESYIAKTNKTYALTDGTSIEAFEMLLEVVKSMGLAAWFVHGLYPKMQKSLLM